MSMSETKTLNVLRENLKRYIKPIGGRPTVGSLKSQFPQGSEVGKSLQRPRIERAPKQKSSGRRR